VWKKEEAKEKMEKKENQMKWRRWRASLLRLPPMIDLEAPRSTSTYISMMAECRAVNEGFSSL